MIGVSTPSVGCWPKPPSRLEHVAKGEGNDVTFHSLYLGRKRCAFWKQLMKVSKIGLENLKLIAIHAISRTGDVPLTSGKTYDMTAAAAVRTTSVSDGLGCLVCQCVQYALY